jgi:glucosamine 6-phosphate synthetase-like amidotransferase/phosphosugar isomerase protein
MCSISGFITRASPIKQVQLARGLLYAGRERGIDSAGVVSAAYLRMVGDPVRCANALIASHFNGVALCHTRAASRGAVTVENAHPIELRDGAFLIHNGTVMVDDLPDYFYKTETDSERLGALIARKGLKAAFREAPGSAAIALLDKRRKTLTLARKVSPLVLAWWRESGELVFASTLDMLKACLHLKNAKVEELRDGWALNIRFEYLPEGGARVVDYDYQELLRPTEVWSWTLERKYKALWDLVSE